ncbi:MAG: hypothetical protein A3H28_02585 [Acidobacteria bacterium RIFCSPLOWO2_02_FULL_61_28]|nr:MAG: hypothetical protein A3H28_02585 [Acidobacteria bacterium RIFCSPLOWO2_02_FULL_61_28]
MRKLNRLWQALEQIPALLAISAFWEHHCGPDYPVIRPYLRATDSCGSTYPCPAMGGGNCPRRIVDYGDGEIVALCRDPWINCGEVPLTRVDTLIHELDITAFTKDIAVALGIRWHAPNRRGHCIWSVGLSTRRANRHQPVFFAAVSFSEQFHSGFRDLLVEVEGPFVLLVPTHQYRNVSTQELILRRGITFVSLEEQVLLDDHGKFVSVDPLENTDRVPCTPLNERQRLIETFRAKYDITAQKVADEAEVDIRDLYKWIAGQIKDSSKKSKRIEALLCRGLTKRPRP